MKKLSSLLIVVLVIAILPLAVMAQNVPATAPSRITAWSRVASPGTLAPSAKPESVLWDQYSNASGYVYASQDFEAIYDDYDIYAADDFANAVPWTIDTILVQGGGWNGYTSLLDASAVHWYLYADASGQPSGYPGDDTEFWALSLPPTDAQVTYGADESLLLTLDTPIELPVGHWWLVYFISLEFDLYGQYGWQSTLNAPWGTPGMQANPGGAFGFTDWQVNDYNEDYLFRLEGEAEVAGNVTCGEITAIPRLDPHGRYIVKWQVEAVDDGGEPVADVTVTADLTIPAGRTVTRARVTRLNGIARFHWGSYIPGDWSIDVTNMTLTGYTFVDGPKCSANFTNE